MTLLLPLLLGARPSLAWAEFIIHGRCWNEGKRGQLVVEWEERKVEEMLAVVLAKYRAHPAMGEELLEGSRGCTILG